MQTCLALTMPARRNGPATDNSTNDGVCPMQGLAAAAGAVFLLLTLLVSLTFWRPLRQSPRTRTEDSQASGCMPTLMCLFMYPCQLTVSTDAATDIFASHSGRGYALQIASRE